MRKIKIKKLRRNSSSTTIFDFGRIAAQTAKQVISFNVREAERKDNSTIL